MKNSVFVVMMTALIVALGGLLMGFDASVISGVVKFIEPEFGLTKLELGWAVASLTLSATFAMMISGPMSIDNRAPSPFPSGSGRESATTIPPSSPPPATAIQIFAALHV